MKVPKIGGVTLLSFVFTEEVLETSKGFWFSPNGEYLAFASFNDSEVLEMMIPDYGVPQSFDFQYPKEKKIKYPKVKSHFFF